MTEQDQKGIQKHRCTIGIKGDTTYNMLSPLEQKAQVLQYL